VSNANPNLRAVRRFTYRNETERSGVAGYHLRMSTSRFFIATDHPALPGHFPGRPVVPGVVLLDRVAAAVERETGMRVAALAQVKFSAPLLPGIEAELRIEEKSKKLHFRILHKAATLASGIVETAAKAEA